MLESKTNFRKNFLEILTEENFHYFEFVNLSKKVSLKTKINFIKINHRKQNVVIFYNGKKYITFNLEEIKKFSRIRNTSDTVVELNKSFLKLYHF